MQSVKTIPVTKKTEITERQLCAILNAKSAADQAPLAQRMDTFARALEIASIPQDATLWLWLVQWGMEQYGKA